jgi:CHAT domain-containing protein
VSLQSVQFSLLPASLREAREVAGLWQGTTRDDAPPTLLLGRAANERSFKEQAHSHRVLHLATHGFFLGGACQAAIAGTRSVGGLLRVRGQTGGATENPLLLSGLAFAGANRRAASEAGDEDGILTAEEVAGLNLEGVEWAVLSACDTGLGEIKAGEGVIGLRRAFQIAGARTVIMSLWSVDDQATRLWMRALYEGRLRKHFSTADAMHQASLSVLRARRARGQSTNPFYWAGFVAAGDWR